MATLTDRIDRFVRWFFNSSPDQTLIEPRPVVPRKAAKVPGSKRSRGAAERRSGKERRSTAIGRSGPVDA
jgi:hypothetical protein